MRARSPSDGAKPASVLTVVVNPTAGPQGRSAEERIRGALAAEGLRANILIVSAREVGAAVREAARQSPVVAVAGGDGTLSAAAATLAGRAAALAPFPLGTRNHFSRRLGIASVEDAARAVALGGLVRVPLGSVNGRTFINHASAGVYPRMVRQRERVSPWTGKTLGNLIAGSQVLARLNNMRLTLGVEGAQMDRRVPGLWVGLGRGAFRLPVDGHVPSGGELEVVLPHTQSRVRFVVLGFRALWWLWRGRRRDPAGLEVFHTPSFLLESAHPIDLSRDGEAERVMGPLHFRLHPDALSVLSLARQEERTST